ncbi:MAG: Minf_1886 family protein [Fimbriiglobus sp.]
MELKIWDVIRDDNRYSYEAHEFLCDAVSYTQESLGRYPEEGDDPETDYHINAEELARGTCELAVNEFGMMAPIVFKSWGIRSTGDIGEIVFNLIKAEKLSQSDRDHLEDFDDLFCLDEALTQGFEIVLARPRKGVR